MKNFEFELLFWLLWIIQMNLDWLASVAYGSKFDGVACSIKSKDKNKAKMIMRRIKCDESYDMEPTKQMLCIAQ